MKNILWSFVIVLAATGMCSAQSVLYFPQFVDGTQDQNSVVWFSLISLTNPAAVGTPAATGTITLTRDDATPITGPLYDVTSGNSGNTFQLAGGQTKYLMSASGGSPYPLSLSSGFATVTSSLPVTGTLTFMEYGPGLTTWSGFFPPISEAAVPAATPLTRQAVAVARFPNTDVGVATVNPGTGTATISFQLLDSRGAAVLPPVTRMLAPNNHTSFFVSQLFPSVPRIIFGTMQITSDRPIAATALSFTGNVFATTPAFPVQ